MDGGGRDKEYQVGCVSQPRLAHLTLLQRDDVMARVMARVIPPSPSYDTASCSKLCNGKLLVVVVVR